MNGGGMDSSEETGEGVASVHGVVIDVISVWERRFDQRRIHKDTHITARQQFKQALIDKRCLMSSCKQPLDCIHMSRKLQGTADDDDDDDEQQAIAASIAPAPAAAPASAPATTTTACILARHGDATVPHAAPCPKVLGNVDVAPGCRDTATVSSMRSTPHKTEMARDGRRTGGYQMYNSWSEPMLPPIDPTIRHPQQREVELAAAPGGLYRATVDSPSKLDPLGFEKSGRFSILRKLGFTDLRWVIVGDYTSVVYPLFDSGYGFSFIDSVFDSDSGFFVVDFSIDVGYEFGTFFCL